MSSRVIAVIGSLNQDMIVETVRVPESGETITSSSFSTHPGGKGANQAVAAHRASHINPKKLRVSPKTSGSLNQRTDIDIRVYMTGAVGADEFGPSIINKLAENELDVSGIQTAEGCQTGTAIVIVESSTGANRILINPGANHSLAPDRFKTVESLAGGVKPDLVILQLEIRQETVEQVLETASMVVGVDVLLNPAPAVPLPSHVYKRITHLIVNETEAAMLTGRRVGDMTDATGWATVADEFLDKGVKNVMITLGDRGAYYSNKDGDRGHVEAEKGVNVVDTTGAGYVNQANGYSFLSI